MRLPDAPPRDARPLMAEERTALLELLATLDAADWARPSPCPGWSVQDVAAHVLGEDLGLLARGRDGHDGVALEQTGDYREFVDALNEANQRWVEAARRMSPRQLRELLATTGEQLTGHLAGADLAAPASVAWMGVDPVPGWFDLARHYTERWVHQQQIRQAVGRPGLACDRHLGAVLRTFVWSYSGVPVPGTPGTEVGVTFTGPGGGEWTLSGTADGWELEERAARSPDASIRMPSDAAWRVFTDAVDDLAAIEITGDQALARPFLEARAIIV